MSYKTDFVIFFWFLILNKIQNLLHQILPHFPYISEGIFASVRLAETPFYVFLLGEKVVFPDAQVVLRSLEPMDKKHKMLSFFRNWKNRHLLMDSGVDMESYRIVLNSENGKMELLFKQRQLLSVVVEMVLFVFCQRVALSYLFVGQRNFEHCHA